jgi:hypothetical protein
MPEPNLESCVAPIEMLPPVEGPAQLNPAVFAGPREREAYLADPDRISEAATWVTVHSGPTIADPALAARRAEVVAFLADWRRRHGPVKLDELKQQVLRKYERGKADPVETRRRIDALFAESGG